MASRKDITRDSPDLIQGDNETTIANHRLRLAVSALLEIDTLARVLRLHADDELSYLIARGITMRMQELSSVAVSVLESTAEMTDELCHRVTSHEPLQVA
jgi:hypothetical protein